MEHYKTESLQTIGILQKACEILVVHNHVELTTEFNVQRRSALMKEANSAEDLIKEFQGFIKK